MATDKNMPSTNIPALPGGRKFPGGSTQAEIKSQQWPNDSTADGRYDPDTDGD